ncbi:hypothetical protein [Trichlorobacter lovleyi]|uniref:Uncharacterized protein n=1 Tax=Trichlorobacter lovleyi (strain ATCC BAA-1151 / DSM 17278 / SZ) TaxID=398767 RepID=B3EBW1_TRIL1|nr:hypothetical protein [Trichlorobacter lovleyi]ACD97393.1 hypothetical protein Glov_3694 [Trichlorobacter lovleyi SZ]
MDPVKLREKAEKLLQKARNEERKQKEVLNRKVSAFVLSFIKNNGYNFDTIFADGIKAVIESSPICAEVLKHDKP